MGTPFYGCFVLPGKKREMTTIVQLGLTSLASLIQRSPALEPLFYAIWHWLRGWVLPRQQNNTSTLAFDDRISETSRVLKKNA
jgi:hypothetical protein